MGIGRYHIMTTLLLAILLFACKSGDDVVYTPPPAPTDLVDPLDNVDLPLDSLKDIVKGYRTKDRYNISLLLPLYLNKMEDDEDYRSSKDDEGIYQGSKMGLDFYQGVAIALKELKALGFKTDVHIYDTENDTSVVNALFKTGKLDSSDLIIGPVFNSEMRWAAKWAKLKQIPIVSPLSPGVNVSTKNPYYIQMNPGLDAHCWKIYEHLLSKHKGKNIVLAYQLEGDEISLVQMIDRWEKARTDSTGDTTFRFQKFIYLNDEEEGGKEEGMLGDDDPSGITEYFEEFDSNLVVVLSVDFQFVSKMSSALYNLREDYLVKLYGLPVLGEYDHLRIDHMEALNTHFTTEKYMDIDKMVSTSFYWNYIDSFYVEPNTISTKGYDIMLYFGKILNTYGLDFMTMSNEQNYAGSLNDIRLQLVHARHVSTNPRFVPVFYQNMNVHLLKYQDLQLMKVK